MPVKHVSLPRLRQLTRRLSLENERGTIVFENGYYGDSGTFLYASDTNPSTYRTTQRRRGAASADGSPGPAARTSRLSTWPRSRGHGHHDYAVRRRLISGPTPPSSD